MKLRLFVIVAFLFFTGNGFCQVADSILHASQKVNTNQNPAHKSVAEIRLDSINKAALIQAAIDNPNIKNSVAYQLLIYGNDKPVLTTEVSASIDSVNRAALIQAAKDNPGMKNSEAYKHLMDGYDDSGAPIKKNTNIKGSSGNSN